MTPARAVRRAFTLLELLVATALLISIVAVATLSLNQLLNMVRRLQALQDMNGAAALVHSRLTRQVSAMHPCTALWLSQDASDRSVELVFMHGREVTKDWYTKMLNTDQLWTRWSWSESDGVLRISQSRGERNFLIGQNATTGYWKVTPNTMTGRNRFLLIPQPVRDPGAGGPQAPLDSNRWDTELNLPQKAAGDIGDYTDLKQNAIPVLQNCIACTIEIVDLDGNTHTADGSATSTWAAPGAFVDGRTYADRGKTPSIVRLRFTLATSYLLGDISAAAKDKTLVQATYSFSASAPNDTRY